jgi:hypothetical protein
MIFGLIISGVDISNDYLYPDSNPPRGRQEKDTMGRSLPDSVANNYCAIR